MRVSDDDRRSWTRKAKGTFRWTLFYNFDQLSIAGYVNCYATVQDRTMNQDGLIGEIMAWEWKSQMLFSVIVLAYVCISRNNLRENRA